MLKKIAYAGLAIGITAGAIHSYDQVRFGERTAVFFRVTLADEGDFRAGRGRGDFERRSDSDRWRESTADSTRWRTFQRDSTSRSAAELREGRRSRLPREQGQGVEPSAGTAESREFRPRRNEDGSRRGRGRGRAVSLEEVGHYTLILSFVAMVSYLLDGAARKMGRALHVRNRKLLPPLS